MASTTPETEQGLLPPTPGDGSDTKPSAQEEEVDYGDVQVKCGIRSCAPRVLQPCADVRAYTANVSVLLLIHIATFTYYVGILRTLEKRFGLSSTEVNLPMAVTDLMSTFLGLLVGYCGHRLHIPRAMAFGNLLTGVGILVYVLPYVLYGTMEAEFNTASGFNVSGSAGRGQPLCMLGEVANVTATLSTNVGDLAGGGSCGVEDAVNLGILRGVKFGAYACLITSAVFCGFGGPIVGTLALPYLDENATNEDSAMYVGIVTSMYAWSPIVGFLFAAFCTRMPENLTGPTNLTPADPRWIGAWWLGFLVFGIAILVTSLPLAMFPKHMKYYYIENKKKKKAKKDRVKKFSVQKELKNFPKELWSLASNMPYLMLTLSKITGLYVVTGIFLQLPRYFEIHFGQPAYIANIISGTSGAVVGAVGNILGGFLMKRFKIGVVGSARMYVYALVVGVISTTVSMLLACPQMEVTGRLEPANNRLDVVDSCNEFCGCSLKSLRPVCANATTNYITACHAGCTEYDPLNGTYSSCGCTSPDQTVTEGFCSSDKCRMLIPYVLVGVIGSLLGSIGRVPATMLMFRVVKKEEKAFAIGLLSMGINLLCFVPAPILFGQLFDSACQLWQDTCGRRGSCMLYDIAKFRYYMHGVTLVFQGASLVFGIIVLILVTRKYKDGEPGEADANENVEKKKEEESRLN